MAPSLRALAEADVRNPLPQSDLLAALTSPPFLAVPGTFNTRDPALVPGASRLRPGLALRSGSLERLAPEGGAVLAGQLGVRRVFDLRTPAERARGPDPAVEGVENVWAPTEEGDATVRLERFVEGQGEEGYRDMYLDVLKMYTEAFRGVLEHVRDREGEPFLFHCTAGRDRTGVLAGMLMTLAGEDPDVVALDYILSRVGTEPAREQLLAFARHGAGIVGDDVEVPGFYNLASLKEPCWRAFLQGLEAEYGGFEGYVTGKLGFSEEDLGKIKANLARK
ncbi:Tyrosine-protein phosphatase [Pleurostoma richardsiae]|uniref:Tyrosine-protein phosphatase n=1 Tax=Pleurostoma richardsiae TaxID=41990 RepID=A0AA38RKL8_9PEZI|nr:Tyrosine-protein phosphatase [Pleurostoma richardsiae]